MTTLNKQIENLQNQFLHTLRNELKLKLHPDTYVIIQENRIEIGVLNIEKTKEDGLRSSLFGSQLNINYGTDYFGKKKDINLNFGTCGSFVPTNPEHSASVQRTIHSAEIVSNWEAIEGLTIIYCDCYVNICKVFQDIRRKETENN